MSLYHKNVSMRQRKPQVPPLYFPLEFVVLQDLLKSSPLFTLLTDRELALVLAICTARGFAGGECLCCEGEDSTCFSLVVEGAVRISKLTPLGEEALAVLRPGQFYGEMGLLTGEPRTAHVYGHEMGKVLEFPNDALKALLDKEPRLGTHFLWAFSRALCLRLGETNTRLATFMTLNKFG